MRDELHAVFNRNVDRLVKAAIERRKNRLRRKKSSMKCDCDQLDFEVVWDVVPHKSSEFLSLIEPLQRISLKRDRFRRRN